MWKKSIRQSSIPTLKKGAGEARARRRRSQLAQGTIEYILVLAVVIGVFIKVIRPGLTLLQDKIGRGNAANPFLSETAGGAGYYYFPM
jgi:hypothetical protein